jgi:hypothetical protein
MKKNLFADIGTNPSPFFMGWLSAVIGIILGIVLAHFIFIL